MLILSLLNITDYHQFDLKTLINLIETIFYTEGTLYLVCDDKIAFFTSDDKKMV